MKSILLDHQRKTPVGKPYTFYFFKERRNFRKTMRYHELSGLYKNCLDLASKLLYILNYRNLLTKKEIKKMKKSLVLVAVLSFSLWSPSVVKAVLIDFDSLANGSYTDFTIGDVKFENNLGNLNVEDIGPLQPPFSEYAVVGPSSQTPGEWNKATFLNGISVYSVSVDMGDKGADFDTLVLKAYDSLDNLLASVTMLNPSGSYSALTLSVSTATPIAYALFNEQGNNNFETGYPGTAYFDNFRYSENPPVNGPVPEPATLLLLGSGLTGLIGFRKKFKK